MEVIPKEVSFAAAKLSTRYIPTSLTGPITVRLTFASNAVLVPKATGIAIGTALAHNDDRTTAATLTYAQRRTATVPSCHAPCLTVRAGGHQ